MTTFIAYTITLLMLIGMTAGTHYQIDGLITVCVSISWMLSILVLPVAFAIIAVSLLYEKSSGESRKKLEKTLVDAAKKKSLIAKAFGWASFIAMTALFAWSGWIVTAVVYVLASLIMKLANSIAKDEAIKQGLA